jgi:large subunit ribosomal protein L15
VGRLQGKSHETPRTEERPGAIHRKKRVGCGEGGGHGKTSGRGGKGQSARSGSSIRPGFEGGQMPLYRKLPHRGFNNYEFRTEIAVVNLRDLAGSTPSVTGDRRRRFSPRRASSAPARPVKVLGDGEITRALKITAARFSGSAKAKIEKAGGQAIVG